jgi:hypothetical protein
LMSGSSFISRRTRAWRRASAQRTRVNSEQRTLPACAVL